MIRLTEKTIKRNEQKEVLNVLIKSLRKALKDGTLEEISQYPDKTVFFGENFYKPRYNHIEFKIRVG